MAARFVVYKPKALFRRLGRLLAGFRWRLLRWRTRPLRRRSGRTCTRWRPRRGRRRGRQPGRAPRGGRVPLAVAVAVVVSAPAVVAVAAAQVVAVAALAAAAAAAQA